MYIRIDDKSKVPIYLQIYENVVSAIASGAVEGGYVLPSARKLARNLGINYHTANKAYNLLEIEGFVTTGSKKTIVSERTREMADEFIQRMRSVLSELLNEAKAKGVVSHEVRDLLEHVLSAVYNSEEPTEGDS